MISQAKPQLKVRKIPFKGSATATQIDLDSPSNSVCCDFPVDHPSAGGLIPIFCPVAPEHPITVAGLPLGSGFLLRERIRSGIAAANKRGGVFGRRSGQRVKADRYASSRES